MFADFLLFEPDRYFFNRVTKDMKPYYEVERDGKIVLVLNALGVSKDDVQVEVNPSDNPNRQILKISGKTHKDDIDKDYSVNMEFFVRPLASIEWSVEDGLISLELSYEEPVKPSVKINRK